MVETSRILPTYGLSEIETLSPSDCAGAAVANHFHRRDEAGDVSAPFSVPSPLSLEALRLYRRWSGADELEILRLTRARSPRVVTDAAEICSAEWSCFLSGFADGSAVPGRDSGTELEPVGQGCWLRCYGIDLMTLC